MQECAAPPTEAAAAPMAGFSLAQLWACPAAGDESPLTPTLAESTPKEAGAMQVDASPAASKASPSPDGQGLPM